MLQQKFNFQNLRTIPNQALHIDSNNAYTNIQWREQPITTQENSKQQLINIKEKIAEAQASANQLAIKTIAGLWLEDHHALFKDNLTTKNIHKIYTSLKSELNKGKIAEDLKLEIKNQIAEFIMRKVDDLYQKTMFNDAKELIAKALEYDPTNELLNHFYLFMTYVLGNNPEEIKLLIKKSVYKDDEFPRSVLESLKDEDSYFNNIDSKEEKLGKFLASINFIQEKEIVSKTLHQLWLLQAIRKSVSEKNYPLIRRYYHLILNEEEGYFKNLMTYAFQLQFEPHKLPPTSDSENYERENSEEKNSKGKDSNEVSNLINYPVPIIAFIVMGFALVYLFKSFFSSKNKEHRNSVHNGKKKIRNHTDHLAQIKKLFIDKNAESWPKKLSFSGSDVQIEINYSGVKISDLIESKIDFDLRDDEIDEDIIKDFFKNYFSDAVSKGIIKFNEKEKIIYIDQIDEFYKYFSSKTDAFSFNLSFFNYLKNYLSKIQIRNKELQFIFSIPDECSSYLDLKVKTEMAVYSLREIQTNIENYLKFIKLDDITKSQLTFFKDEINNIKQLYNNFLKLKNQLIQFELLRPENLKLHQKVINQVELINNLKKCFINIKNNAELIVKIKSIDQCINEALDKLNLSYSQLINTLSKNKFKSNSEKKSDKKISDHPTKKSKLEIKERKEQPSKIQGKKTSSKPKMTDDGLKKQESYQSTTYASHGFESEISIINNNSEDPWKRIFGDSFNKFNELKLSNQVLKERIHNIFHKISSINENEMLNRNYLLIFYYIELVQLLLIEKPIENSSKTISKSKLAVKLRDAVCDRPDHFVELLLNNSHYELSNKFLNFLLSLYDGLQLSEQFSNFFNNETLFIKDNNLIRIPDEYISTIENVLEKIEVLIKEIKNLYASSKNSQLPIQEIQSAFFVLGYYCRILRDYHYYSAGFHLKKQLTPKDPVENSSEQNVFPQDMLTLPANDLKSIINFIIQMRNSLAHQEIDAHGKNKNEQNYNQLTIEFINKFIENDGFLNILSETVQKAKVASEVSKGPAFFSNVPTPTEIFVSESDSQILPYSGPK